MNDREIQQCKADNTSEKDDCIARERRNYANLVGLCKDKSVGIQLGAIGIAFEYRDTNCIPNL